MLEDVVSGVGGELVGLNPRVRLLNRRFNSMSAIYDSRPVISSRRSGVDTKSKPCRPLRNFVRASRIVVARDMLQIRKSATFSMKVIHSESYISFASLMMTQAANKVSTASQAGFVMRIWIEDSWRYCKRLLDSISSSTLS
jgi:hypothetical protein